MKRKSRKLKSRAYSTQTSLSYDRLSSLFAIAQKINQVNDLHKLLHEILHSAITNIGLPIEGSHPIELSKIRAELDGLTTL